MTAPLTLHLAVAIIDYEQRIRAHGYTLTYRQFVEDHLSPGFPGQIAGRTDRAGREVVVGTAATPSPILRLRVLKHELRHIEEPGWDCGCRSVFDSRPDLPDREGLTR